MIKIIILLLITASPCWAANIHCGASATGNGSGSDWNNQMALPRGTSPVRGNVYYAADGSYGSSTFNTSESGTTLITIKKATEADHGSATGWSSAFGDGQATFGSTVTFDSNYWIFDGNGTHTVPSKTSADYGFKVETSSLAQGTGIIKIGTSSGITDITIKYVHSRCTQNADNADNGTVNVRFYPSADNFRIKLQNCYIENSGKDGMQLNQASFVLIERCFMRRLGKKHNPSHGQTIMMFHNHTDIIFRWNIFEACEGEALCGYGADNQADNGVVRMRWYGNIVYYRNATVEQYAFNSGLVANHYSVMDRIEGILLYNNTFVNLRDSLIYNGASFPTRTHFPVESSASKVFAPMAAYNQLFYNCNTSSVQQMTTSHHASGGLGTAGGSSEQTGIPSSIFVNYSSNDFRLATATTAGKTVSGESWWDTSDTFFGFLDSNLDMYGTVRGADGTWDRGAIEFSAGGQPGSIQLSAASYQVGEAGGTVTITATRTGGSTGAVGVSYATSNSTATSGSDYTSASSTLSWADAETADKTFAVTITQDADVEGDETFTATLSSPTGGASLGSPSAATVTIVDDEAPSIPLMGGLIFEAEDGLIESPFAVASGAIAQPSEVSNPASGGRARYRVTIPSTGDYRMEVEVDAATTGSNSFYIEFDAEPTEAADVCDIISLTTGVETRGVNHRGAGAFDNPEFQPKVWNLTAGEHILYVRGREASTELDSWAIITTVTSDTEPPSPDPMTWESPPSADDQDSITMTASLASDATVPVEYSFEETGGQQGGTNSGWQTSRTYTDTGLVAGRQYTYRVRARDAVGTPNVTGYSTSLSDTTDQLENAGCRKVGRSSKRGSRTP